MLASLVLEQSVVTIYNCIFGPAGRQAEPFLGFMADFIAIEVDGNPGPASSYLEITSTRTEYLPLKDPRQWHIGGLSGLLDRNFRLLREDTIGQLRDVIHTELQHDNMQTSRKNQARTHVYQKATVNSLHLGRFSGMQFLVSYDRQTSFALKRRNEKSGGNFPSGCSQMRLFVSWIQRDMQYSAQCLLSAGTGEGKAPMPASGRCPHRFQRALAMPL